MRNSIRLAALALTATMFVVSDNLLAQRRTEGSSGGSGTRSTPSSSSGGGETRASGGGRSSGGETRASSGEGRRTSGSDRAQPSTRSRDGNDQPSTSTRRGDGGSASSGTRAAPSSGKIASVRRGATAARARGGKVIVGGGAVWIGGCWGCDYWGWYGGRWGRYHGGYWYPDYYGHYDGNDYREADHEEEEEGGQGYLDYPYARSENGEETFVRGRVRQNRGFAALSGWGFSDMGSTTRAGRLSFEGAVGVVRGSIDYGRYDEPLQTRTDRMHTLRINAGVQPRLGERAYLVAAIGARGLFVDSSDAWGPEGELGIQLFPMKPLGANITGRIASLSWEGDDHFTVRELNTTGSIFLGRVELQGGWHWMKIADAPAFGGPIAGIRLWF